MLLILYNMLSKIFDLAQAGVAQWIERGPVNQRVTGSIPILGTCLGCRPGPQKGVCERQPTWMFLSLSFSLPSPLSKNNETKSCKRVYKEER